MTRIETGPTAGVATALGLAATADLHTRYPVIGWRSWQFGVGYLRSITRLVQWPRKLALSATCPIHKIPEFDSTCGIYAQSDRRGLARAPYIRNMPTPGRVVVFGAVSLWGHVIEHQNGWRAQYAYPRAIWVVTDRIAAGIGHLVARAIAENYGVPMQVVTPKYFNPPALQNLADDATLWSLVEMPGENVA